MLGKIRNRFFGKKVGLDGFVVVILIIIICLVIGALFKDQLITYFTGVFQQLTGKSTGWLG